MTDQSTTTTLALETVPLPVSAGERNLIAELLQPPTAGQATRELDAPTALEQLEILCRVSVAIEQIRDWSKPVIGRLLVVIRNNPAFYKGLGYGNFNAFVEQHVVEKLGFSRSDAYTCLRIVLKMPDLSPQAFQKIGTVKMLTLTRAFRGEEPIPKRYLAFAQRVSVRELRARLQEDSLLAPGEDEAFLIQISTDKDIGRRWWQFCKDELIQKHCGSDRPDQILLHLMEECEGPWRETAEKEAQDGATWK